MNGMQSKRLINPGKRQSSGSHPTGETPLTAACLQVVDTGLWCIVFVVPLLLGGRHPLGRMVLALLCAAVATAWFCRKTVQGGTWTRTAPVCLMLAAFALVGCQVVPIPASWLAVLAPRNASLLSLWTNNPDVATRMGEWRTLSIDPEATRLALATLIAYGLLFVTVVQRLGTSSDVHRLLRWIGLSAIFNAAFGFLQYMTANGRFLWFYEYPFTGTVGDLKGGFTCRNHFSHFLVLGMAALIAWLVERNFRANPPAKTTRKHVRRGVSTQTHKSHAERMVTLALIAGLGLVVCAVLLALSRGGIVAMMVVTLVAASIYHRAGFISSEHIASALGLIAVVVAVLSFHGGYEKVSHRVDELAAGSWEELDSSSGRRLIWSANLEAIQDGWLTGSGAGTHRIIYPVYLDQSLDKEYTHAENSPLQVITENGFPGAALLTIGILVCGVWCYQAVNRSPHRADRIYAGGVTAALSASLVHGMVDWVWFVPPCMAVTILFAACALRLAQLATAEEAITSHDAPLSRTTWISLATAITLLGVWAVATLAKPGIASVAWDRYLLASIAKADLRKHQLTQSAVDPAELERSEEMLTGTMISNLQQVLRWRPEFATAHLRLASKYLRKFDLEQRQAANSMTSVEVRQAALASGFQSADQLRNWLHNAFGDNSALLYRAYYHAQKALQLSPLQGEGYVLLANLCFLDGHGLEAMDSYLRQAQAVRPHKGNVIYNIGLHRIHLGQYDAAVELWQSIYHDRGSHQQKITEFLAGHTPVVNFLQAFAPNWQTLRHVWRRYSQLGTEEDLQLLLSYTVEATGRETTNLPPHSASRLWLQLAHMQRELHQHETAVVSLCQGHLADPNNFVIRQLLGHSLLTLGQATEAEKHLRWCLSRRPDHGGLRKQLLEATKIRLAKRDNQTTHHLLQ